MTVSPDFDRLYDEEVDPWSVGSSWYEQRKIDIVLAALAERRYCRALDPACGTGHLAQALAERCDEVVACDASPAAISVARDVCRGAANVHLSARRLPYAAVPPQDELSVPRDVAQIGQYGAVPPRGPFDLIVLSEFLYYLSDDERTGAIEGTIDLAADRVEIAAVHWRERPDDAIATGEGVHDQLRGIFAGRGFRHQVAHFDEEFVLDVFTRGHDHYIA